MSWPACPPRATLFRVSRWAAALAGLFFAGLTLASEGVGEGADAPGPATGTVSGEARPAARLVTRPPDDFLEMLRPMRTSVDVYYGGDFLFSTLAEYTPATLEFLDPEALITRIPNLVSRLALQNHLSGPLPRNSDLVCRHGQPTDTCGMLAPDFAGILFDEARFRVDLFIHPELLLTSRPVVSRYLPAPRDPHAVSLVQNLNAVAASDVNGQGNHSITGLTWVGRGMERVYGRWYSTDYNSFSVEELAWQRDTQDHEYTAGVFQARPDLLLFSGSGFLAGGGFGRSLKTRTDLEHAVGSEITLFLTGRSQIDIFRDGRLVSSRIYAAGNQVLDTSRLPGGAYNIDLRITDAGGTARTEQRFFSKSNRLAPRDTPLYFIQAGSVVVPNRSDSFPVDNGRWLARGAYQQRLRDELGWVAGGALTDSHALAEGGLTWLHPAAELSLQGMLASTGDQGVSLIAFGRHRRLSGTAGLRRVWQDGQSNTDDNWLVGSAQSQRQLSLNHPLGAGMLQASTERRRDPGGAQERHALRYQLPLPFRLSLSLTTELARENGDLIASLSVSTFHNAPGLAANASLTALHQSPAIGPDTTDVAGTVGVGWRDEDRYAADVEANARFTAETDANLLTLSGLHASQFGRLEATAEHVDVATATSGVRGALTADTNFVVSGGQFSWGGAQLAPSAVVLDLRGESGDALFDVLVDDRRVTSVSAGRRALLPLAAYERYSVRLADRGTDFLAFDNSARDVTLYPGNAETLAWDVQRVRVHIGRLFITEQVCIQIDDNCQMLRRPMRHALLEGTHGFAMTDDDGRFQAEILSGTARIRARRGDLACEVVLPENPVIVNGIADLGDITCEGARSTGSGVRQNPGVPAPPDGVAGERLEVRSSAD